MEEEDREAREETAPLPEHVRRNRESWDAWAVEYVEPGERNREVRPPEGATTRYPFVTLEWSRRWPCEDVWRVRRR